MATDIQAAISLACAAMLLVLRLDSRRFRAAESDDESEGWRSWVARLSWLAMGLALVLLVFVLNPQPVSRLHLDLGEDRPVAIALGLLYGAIGAALVVLFARLRYGFLRFPPGRRYPGAIVMACGIAIIDEALFRGVLLGLLLSFRLQPWAAVILAAVAYGVCLQVPSGRQGLAVLAVNCGVGIAGGLLVLATNGIGAGIIGLAMTRVALFAATGRRGRSIPPRFEADLAGNEAVPPPGWSFVPDQDAARGGYGPARHG